MTFPPGSWISLSLPFPPPAFFLFHLHRKQSTRDLVWMGRWGQGRWRAGGSAVEGAYLDLLAALVAGVLCVVFSPIWHHPWRIKAHAACKRKSLWSRLCEVLVAGVSRKMINELIIAVSRAQKNIGYQVLWGWQWGKLVTRFLCFYLDFI